MASIAIMIGGAVLNAAAFTGGNYLAKYIAGDSGQAALAEKTRFDKALEAKLAKIYYSPQGYWKGLSAIKKLAEAAKVPENVSKQWLYKQAIWQIYLPAPRHVPRPKFDVATPNSVHQADLLFLRHDKLPRGRKIYKYALTVVDIASRYKEAEPLTSKNSDKVAKAFKAIYRRGPLTCPVHGRCDKRDGKTQNVHSSRAH